MLLTLLAGFLAASALAGPPVKPPKELVDAIKQRFPHGKIVRAEKAPYYPLDEGGSWDVTVENGKEELGVQVSAANGCYQINTIAKAVAPVDVPKFVLETLHAKYPQATITSAREVQQGLMGWGRKSSKPPDYELKIVTTEKETFDVWLTPEFKQNAEGEDEPDPGKVRISSVR